MVQTVKANTQLIILQHPTEVKRAKGTAKILSLSLPNSFCFIGEDFNEHKPFNELLQQSDYQNLLLYPSSGADVLADVISDSVDNTSVINEKKKRLIIIDGTWKKAYKMYQLSKNLHSLTACALPQSIEGSYTIRKAPDSNSLSTVEAGYHALSLIEPEINFQPLMTAFDSMIKFYLKQIPEETVKSNYRHR